MPPQLPFGQLLKQRRVAAGLTQEALAARAGLAVRSISDLERGLRRAPYRDSVAKLADALQLSPDEQAEFEAAARRQSSPHASTSRDTPTSSPHPPVTPTVSYTHPAFSLAREHSARLASALAAVRARGALVARLASVLLVGVLIGGTLLSAGATGQRPLAGGTLCLAAEVPTVGDSGPFALALEHAVQLAVEQNQFLGDGYTLKVLHYREPANATARQDPQQAAKNVTEMVQTPCILAMVGPLSSRVAAVEMPITARAGLTMISPANTMPGLTMRLYAADYQLDFDHLHPAGKETNYFRTIVNDAFQGRELADFASRQPPIGLGARRAFVVDDHTPYGEELVGGFTQEFLAQDGVIVGTDGVPFGGVARIAELAARIVAARPDVVCFGGTVDGGGGTVEAQLAQAGYSGLFVGGDGIAQDPAFIEQTSAAVARDVYAINPVPDPAQATSEAATTFVHAFHASYPGEDVDGYGANAYDAVMILITAMKSLIRAGKNVTRQSVLAQVQRIQYVGVTGPINFDRNGDNAHGAFSLYTVQHGKWVWVKQETV
jgi:branched-chain amino acid transport system substrate-binding protein